MTTGELRQMLNELPDDREVLFPAYEDSMHGSYRKATRASIEIVDYVFLTGGGSAIVKVDVGRAALVIR